jgi:hypothetical protein
MLMVLFTQMQEQEVGNCDRDKSGEVLAAGAGSIRYAASTVQTEAIAAYKGLHLAAQLGMTNIIFGNGCYSSGDRPHF